MSNFEGGKKYSIKRDIRVGDEIAFSEGDSVAIDSIADCEDRPENRYVVRSVRLNRNFRLSKDDLAEVEAGGEDPCIHKFKRSNNGTIRCEKCNIPMDGNDEGVSLPSFCDICGQELDLDQSIICGSCGAPNIGLITRNAARARLDGRSCPHSFFYADCCFICIKCGRTRPLRTPAQRQLYMAAMHETICEKCGIRLREDQSFCERCAHPRRPVEPITENLIFNPKQARLQMRQKRMRQTGPPPHAVASVPKRQRTAKAPGFVAPPPFPTELLTTEPEKIETQKDSTEVKANFCCMCGKKTEGELYCKDCAPDLSI